MIELGKQKIKLYEVRKDVRCVKCGNKGAVQSYGKYYPNGVGELADEIKSYEKYRDSEHMSHVFGFGGTIPHECLNCDNRGLIDFGGLEGYSKGFETIKEE